MAIILYKKGDTTKVNGIPCEIQICNEFSYLHLLEQGWFYTPEECYAEEPEETPATEAESTKGYEVRTAAKDAGISHWHTKSIDRLTKELKELEDAERPED